MTENTPYQGMSASVMAELLTLIQAYDRNFVPDELDVKAFRKVAIDFRWTHHEAQAAIHAWGADHPEGQRLDASLLNRLIRTARQEALLRKPIATAFGAKFAEETARQRIMAIYKQEALLSRGRSQRRRKLVLSHPDLAELLTHPTIGYTRPDQWNGWIPPATVPDDSPNPTPGPTTDGPGYVTNDSPRRAALIELVEEAERREAAR